MKPQLYKALIVDDEEHCRDALQRAIGHYCPQLKIIGKASNVAQARELLFEHKPDILFLDVEMPEENGFDLLEQMDSKAIPTIFTTAHESYALKALKKRALDYLLKPIQGAELIAAINKLEYNKHNSATTSNGKIALPTTQGFTFSYPEDILRCEADGAYTRIFRIKDSLLVSRNIGHIEGLLKKHDFFRVHKSHLINLGHVREYIRGKGGTVIMSDNSSVEVSKRKREDFLLAVSF